MERIQIDVYISDLLYSYDCVIVPDLGGFVANYAPAQIQAVQHKFNPPSKKVSFNKNLKNNDGLLTNHIAERRSISYEEAGGLIRSFVNRSIAGLKQGDKIHIEKVGTLYLDPEQNVQFKAEESNDYLLDSFGLGSFRALPIQREGLEERLEKGIKEKLPSIKEEAKRKKRYWPAAAALAILVASTVALNSQFKWIDNSQLQYSFLSFSDKAAARYEAKKIEASAFDSNLDYENKLNFDRAIVPFVTSSGEKTAMYVDNRETAVDNTKVVDNSSQNLVFHVMGGCFSQYSNATTLVNTLQEKGYDARLLGQYKNLHAVSYSSFASREEAVQLLDDVRNSDNPNAWLLVKPF
jgi:hypothetical protein